MNGLALGPRQGMQPRGDGPAPAMAGRGSAGRGSAFLSNVQGLQCLAGLAITAGTGLASHIPSIGSVPSHRA
eukprot:1695855-Prorocentrum_lima.AAC.1